MLLLGFLAACLLFGLYVIFVRTAPGQRFDDIAFEGRKATRLAARRPATFLVHMLTVPSILIGCLAIAVDTFRRGWWRTGAVALCSVGLTGLLARLLKGALGRPSLVDLAYASSRNSFPSGHSATVVAVLLAAVSACEPSVRAFLASACALLCAVYAATLLGSGWHRPSDVLAGICLAVLVVATSTAARLLCFQEASDRPGNSAWWFEHLALLVRLGALRPVRMVWFVSACAVVLTALLQNPRSNQNHSLLSYLAVVLACCIVSMSAVFAFAEILGSSKSLIVAETETETRSPEVQ
ncbi:MAG: phosphatase PAP2 family protein [Actinomycetes bacterium]